MLLNHQQMTTLSHTSLFRQISDCDLESALDFLQAELHTYQKDEVLLHLGNPIQYSGIVLSGTVEGSFISDSYDKINMNHFEEGRSFAEALASIPVRHSPIQLKALTDCTILWLNIRNLFSNTLFVYPYQQQLTMNLMRILASQNVFSNLKLRIASEKSLRNRLLVYLHSLTPDHNGNLHIPFSRTALAEFLGVNRSALSREIGRMCDEGLITTDGKVFRLRQF